MCYNVLCDKYATRQLYGYCPSWGLNWEYRKKGIIEEVRHYSADIITLQVQPHHSLLTANTMLYIHTVLEKANVRLFTTQCIITHLQEVETDQFYNFFLPELKRDGYDGIFSPKSRARTMSETERKHVDGCAIFYRTSKYVHLYCSYPVLLWYILTWVFMLVKINLYLFGKK